MTSLITRVLKPALGNRSAYGMTTGGSGAGGGGDGTVFEIGTDGTYNTLHSFVGGSTDGSSPNGSLTQIGNTLYGMTTQGGAGTTPQYPYGQGTIFEMGIDGSNPTILHSFTGTSTDGSSPVNNSLIQVGSNLYGMTPSGGAFGDGTFFEINPNAPIGANFTLLHSFAGGSNDAEDPHGDLVYSDGYFYGISNQGGSADQGVIFQLDMAGNVTILHSFAAGSLPLSTDVTGDFGSLILSGSTLYGVGGGGGAFGGGGIFQFNLNSGDYSIPLHSFNPSTHGATPQTTLTLIGSNLYGMTTQGGSSGDGTIFSLPLPSSSSAPDLQQVVYGDQTYINDMSTTPQTYSISGGILTRGDGQL